MDREIDARVVEAMEAHQPALQRYVRSLVRDTDEAADVCQETCVRLLTTARANGLPDAPGAWMNRVAYNLVVSSARRRQTATRKADQLVERQTVPALDESVIVRERNGTIRAVLAASRTDDREAMVMAAIGYPIRDIADRLGRTEIATRTLICRARGRVRQELVAADAM